MFFCHHLSNITHFSFYILLYRLWRNILADKPRVTKFPIEWDQVKDEANMGEEQQQQEDQQQQQQQEGGQFAGTGMMEGTTPVTAVGDTDMQME